jgi:phosphoglycolate phosphatase
VTRVTLFDLDGTLLDTAEDLANAVNAALAAVGLPPRSLEEVRSFVGEGARRLMEKAVEGREELVEPALEAWWRHYEAHCVDRTRPYEGIPSLLAGAGRPLAVLTNKPGRLSRRILSELGLAGRFVAVIGGDEGPRKPDPANVRRILAQVGARPEDAVLVGDSRIDVQTAAAAGIACVAVTWGFGTRAELAAAGAAVYCDRVEDLAPHVA